MKVYIISLHDSHAGDSYAFGAFTSIEKAKEIVHNFLNSGGWEFFEEEFRMKEEYTAIYYTCLKNPTAPHYTNIQYRADIDLVTIDEPYFN